MTRNGNKLRLDPRLLKHFFRMEQFRDDIEDDKNGTGQANGETGNVDQVEQFILFNASQGNNQKILPHMF